MVDLNSIPNPARPTHSNHKNEGGNKILTRICQRNRLRVNIPEKPTDWRQNREQDRARGANNQRVEDGRFLMRGPAQVAQGVCPDVRLGHCVSDGRVSVPRGFVSRGVEVREVELNRHEQ